MPAATEHLICLGAEDQQRFAESLLKPPPLVPAMQRALAIHADLVTGSPTKPTAL